MTVQMRRRSPTYFFAPATWHGGMHYHFLDAHAGATITHALIAEGADLRRGGIHAQERVVAAGKNLSKFHDRSSFLMRHEK